MWLISLRITPIVRVPANSSEWISRVLDGGAQAVIVPHVNTAAEAAHVVKCAKFAPIGERSATNGMPQLRYQTLPFREANLVANDLTTVICMIETEDALDNVEWVLAILIKSFTDVGSAIAEVSGLDVLLLGSADLTQE